MQTVKKLPEIIEFQGKKLRQHSRSDNVVLYYPVYQDDLPFYLIGLITTVYRTDDNDKETEEEILLTAEDNKQLVWIYHDFKEALKDFKKKVKEFG